MHALSGGEAVADGARLLRREDLVPFLRKQVSERDIALMVEAARDDRPVAQNGGLLPQGNLVGRAEWIVASWQPGASLFKPWTWFKVRPDRTFQRIR